MKPKPQKMEFNKLKNLTSFYKSAVIILIVLILFFSVSAYVFYGGYLDYRSAVRTDEFGTKLCLVVTDQGEGMVVGETGFSGFHLSARFPNELVTHLAVVVIICLFFPLLDYFIKKNLSKNSDHDTMVQKYTFNKILTVVLLIIFIIIFIFSVFYSVSWVMEKALIFEQPAGSGQYVRPHYSYDWADGELIYKGIFYSSER